MPPHLFFVFFVVVVKDACEAAHTLLTHTRRRRFMHVCVCVVVRLVSRLCVTFFVFFCFLFSSSPPSTSAPHRCSFVLCSFVLVFHARFLLWSRLVSVLCFLSLLYLPVAVCSLFWVLLPTLPPTFTSFSCVFLRSKGTSPLLPCLPPSLSQTSSRHFAPPPFTVAPPPSQTLLHSRSPLSRCNPSSISALPIPPKIVKEPMIPSKRKHRVCFLPFLFAFLLICVSPLLCVSVVSRACCFSCVPSPPPPPPLQFLTPFFLSPSTASPLPCCRRKPVSTCLCRLPLV